MPCDSATIAPASSAVSWMTRSGCHDSMSGSRSSTIRGRTDARKKAGKQEWHSVRRRDVGLGRCGRHEPGLGLRLVESRGISLEPDVPNMAAEARIGRDRDAMTRFLESTRQRNHRVEVALTDNAGEEDLHPAEPTSCENTGLVHRVERLAVVRAHRDAGRRHSA